MLVAIWALSVISRIASIILGFTLLKGNLMLVKVVLVKVIGNHGDQIFG